MCGIIACRTDRPAVDYLRVGLRRLEYRGNDSVGVALGTASGDIVRLRTTGRIDALEELLGQWTGAAFDGVGIGHTRWATHGPVSEGNAHPHTDCTGKFSLVHNGIIENAADLRTALSGAGHRFATAVDSEVLCHLIEDERYRCGDLAQAVQNALTSVRGSWALAVLERGTGRITVAANGSPLLVAHTAYGDFAASDIAAIADWVEEFRVLDDGDVVELTNGRWNRSGVAVTPPVATRCRWHARDVELNGYTDYMAKEIDEQPQAAARVLDELVGGIANGAVWKQLGPPPLVRLRMIGCGTSLNAGNVIGNLARGLGGIPVSTTIASEAADRIPDAGQLCLAVSQSGEAADVLRAMKSRAVAESPLLALSTNFHFTLARRADADISCSAGPEIGVAATKTFVRKIVSGAALMIWSMVGKNRISVALATRLVDEIRRLPELLSDAIMIAKSEVPRVAEEFQDSGGFLFIAGGSGLPYAAEGALKLKELAYRWAEHYPAGELKHGPLALVGPGTPVVVVDNGDPKLASSVAEVQVRGGRVISIGSAGSSIPVATVPGAQWGPLESAIPMQILARNLAPALGHDVDKPTNLAKLVTVE